MGTSVVGTPGVDPSAQLIGQGVGEGATETAGAGFNIATEKQNLRNEGEYASLMVEHSQNIMTAAENIKKQYADHPDAMPGALSKAITDSLTSVSEKASNPFVKLMVGRGDPSAQMWAMRQIQQDSYEQGWRNTLVHATNTLNGLTNESEKIGNNLDLSAQDMLGRLAPLTHVVGQLFTSIDSSAHQQVADEVSNKGMMSIMKGLIDTTMVSQPVKAAQLLANPEVTKYFPPDEIKKYQDQADQSIKSFPTRMMTQQIQGDLSKYPNIIDDVMTGKKGYADIDAWQRMDKSGLNNSFFNYLKDISLNVQSPMGEASGQKDAIKGQIVDEANRLGFKLPGQFASPGEGKDFLAPKIDPNIKDLYKFRDDLMGARARNILSTEEFNTFNKQLLEPLTAATLKKHDPGFFQSLLQSPHSPFKETDPSKVDDFRSPYNIIERGLSMSGMDEKSPEYAGQKAAYYDAYFKALAAVKPGQLNALGRPYSQVDVAHAVLGEELGAVKQVRGQYYKIGGYDPKDGMPLLETDKEWQQALANAKNLKAVQGP